MGLVFKEKYNKYKTEFEERLHNFFDSLTGYDKSIIEAMKYSVYAGGKRLRPVLMFGVSEMLGLDVEKVYPLAIAIECIHTYSLIHDDLPAMDNDVLRRGMATNHVVFGEAKAILAGDGLLNLAFEIILSLNDLDALRAGKYIANCSGYMGMIMGQTIDLDDNKEWNEEVLKTMHEYKTGKLISAALLTPSIILNNKYYDELNEYSKNLGLLFQITDDILDVVSSDEEMGKSVHKDSRDKKLTYVSYYGMEEAKKMAEISCQKCIDSIDGLFNNEFLKELATYVLERKN